MRFKILFMKAVKYVLIVFFSTLTLNSFSQNASEKAIYIEPFYGFPNLITVYSSGGYSSMFPSADINKGNGIGPLGVKTEIKMDKIGFGINASYNTVNSTFFADSLNSDYTLYKTYAVNEKYTQLRVQFRFNFYYLQDKNLYAYLGLGAGSRYIRYSQNSDFEKFDIQSKNNYANAPVSMRICTGFRYFFIENVGANVEIGLGGGPMIAGGASFKF